MYLILHGNSLNLLCCFIHGFVAKETYSKLPTFSSETFPSEKTHIAQCIFTKDRSEVLIQVF